MFRLIPYDIAFKYKVIDVSDRDVEVSWNAILVYIGVAKDSVAGSRFTQDFHWLSHNIQEEEELRKTLDSQSKAQADAQWRQTYALEEFDKLSGGSGASAVGYPEHAWGPGGFNFDNRIDIDEGKFIWRRTTNRVEVIPGSPVSASIRAAGFRLSEGGATGLLHKNDELPSELGMQAYALPGQVLAVTLRIGLDGAAPGLNTWYRAKSVEFPTCDGDNVGAVRGAQVP
jgi:hypothetical protein